MKRWLARFALFLLAASLLAALAAWLFVRNSLPQLDGEQPLAGLAAPVTVQRVPCVPR